MNVDALLTFFSDNYMPHGHCYLWQKHILWTHVLSDLVIAASYFSIPVAILIFAHQRPAQVNTRLVTLFALFILLCGVTHLLAIYTVWNGIYGIHGMAKALTAIVSVITAIYAFKLLPDAIALPSPSQFQGVPDRRAASRSRLRLEQQLADEQLTSFMIDSLPISAMMVDSEEKILLYNKYFSQEFGYHAEDFNNLKLTDIVLADSGDRDCLTPFFSDSAPIKQTLKQQLVQIRCKGNDLIPVEMTLTRDKFKDTWATIVTFKNLAEHQQIKAALLVSHQQLERAINATEDCIWEWQVGSDEMFWSPKMAHLIGLDKATTPSYALYKAHIHPDFTASYEQALDRHFKTGDKFSFEYLGRHRRNEFGWFSVVGNSTFDENHHPMTMSGSLRYIQQSKTLEQQIAEKNKFLNTIYDGVNHAIWVLKYDQEDDFRFVAFNQTAGQRIGVDPANIVGKSLKELSGSVFPPAVIASLRTNYLRCVTERKAVDYIENFLVEQAQHWFRTTLYPVFDEQRQVAHIVGTSIEITEQKDIENKLAENQRFLEKMIDSIACGLYLYDFNDQKHIRINKRYTDILGYQLDDLSVIDDFTKFVHPDDKMKLLTHLSKVISSRNGRLIPCEYRLKHQQGHWVWLSSLDCIVSYDNDGAPSILLGTFNDITENLSLLDKLKQSNEYLERFAFVASHDLQEPVRKIIAFSDSLQERVAPILEHDTDANYQFTRLKSAALRMRAMIQDTLRLSRIYTAETHLQEVKLQNIVAAAGEQLEHLIKETGARIEVVTPEISLTVDKSLMIQLFQNLLNNSIKFRRANEPPIVQVRAHHDNACIKLEVTDNGIGFDDQYARQIFEPFYRLHKASEFQGTGIGLSICRQIVRAHRGTISCSSEKGKGSNFLITIPQPGSHT